MGNRVVTVGVQGEAEEGIRETNGNGKKYNKKLLKKRKKEKEEPTLSDF